MHLIKNLGNYEYNILVDSFINFGEMS